MYGDADVLRSRVDDMREQALDVRALADHLVAQTEGIGWSGRAADAMRRRVSERAVHPRAAATQHDTAADSLDDHVQELQTLQESIARIEDRVADLVSEAVTRAARARHSDGGAAGGAAAGAGEDDDRALLPSRRPRPVIVTGSTWRCPVCEHHRPAHPDATAGQPARRPPAPGRAEPSRAARGRPTRR